MVEKLRHGSPLMIPGLAGGPPFPKKATRNAVVAVASVENPSVPLVVGVCEIDVASLTQVHGMKGHAVRSEHWDGDELWAWSSSGKPGGTAPEHMEGWNVEEGNSGRRQGVESLTIEDNDEEDEVGGVSLDSKPESQQPRNEYVEGEDAEPFERVEEKELSTKGSSTIARDL